MTVAGLRRLASRFDRLASPPAMVAIMLLLNGACRDMRPSSAVTVPPDSADLAVAREVAMALGGDLMSMLTSELARGGPAAAIAVCADSAQERTRRHQQAGVMVRRVGTRLRNPANAPDSVERLVLARFAATIAEGGAPTDTAFVVGTSAGGNELRFLRPVRVQELCLGCHGPADQLGPEVRQVIVARYPEDQATGYAVGELRGAVSVRLALSGPEKPN
jgi:hypothetical protein